MDQNTLYCGIDCYIETLTILLHQRLSMVMIWHADLDLILPSSTWNR